MKRILVMLADGFEELEALSVIDVLRRAKIECYSCSLKDEQVISAHDIKIIADKNINDIDVKDYDGIVLPGGMPGSTNLRDNEKVINLINDFYKAGKLVSAICAAPIVLAKAGIIKGKMITSYPGFESELGDCIYKEDLIVQDKNIITSRGPATAIPFAYEILKYLGYEKEYQDIYNGMLFNLLNK